MEESQKSLTAEGSYQIQIKLSYWSSAGTEPSWSFESFGSSTSRVAMLKRKGTTGQSFQAAFRQRPSLSRSARKSARLSKAT